MLNGEQPSPEVSRNKSATILQIYSIILLACAVYLAYLLVLKLITNTSFLFYILWVVELGNELLLLYWAKQGVAWAKIGSPTMYGKLFRVSIGLCLSQFIIILAELVFLRRDFRWQCGFSLVLRILFYFITKRCYHSTETDEFDPLDIPNFSYERLTEKTERESLFQSFKAMSRELIPLRESHNDIDNPPKSPHGNIRRSFVFS